MRVLFRRARFHLVIYALYFLVGIIVTWPLVTVFSSRLVGHPFGDSYEYIAMVWWFKRALQTGASPFFQPLLAYPDGLAAPFLWSVPLQTFPSWLFAFVMPLPVAFNLSMLLTLALNGWSAFFLAAYLTGNRAAAWAAGLVFMAYPTFQGQVATGHLGLLQVWGVPLYTYALVQTRHSREWRWIVLGAGFFVASLLGSNLLLIYSLFPITAGFVCLCLFRREWAALRRVLVTAGAGGLLALVFVIPAALDTLSAPAALREGDDILFSADLLGVVSPSFQHPLFMGLDYPHRVLGVDPFEKIAYIGIVPGVLIVAALWRRRAARFWLLLGLGAWILSLGPVLKVLDAPVRFLVDGYDTLVTLPWLVAQYIPLLSISRTPARFNFTLALAVAVLAGYGVSVLWDRLARYKRAARWLVVAGMPALILYEYQFFWSNGLPAMPTIPVVIPEPVANLSGRADIRAVLDVPWAHLLTDKEAMFLQTGHQQAMIAGHITRRTPVDPARLTLLQQTLDPALLDLAGADIVIVHKQWDAADRRTESFTRSRLGDPLYEDDHYAVFRVPRAATTPDFTAVLYAGDTFSEKADSYLYTPSPGWTLLTHTLSADGREVSLQLNGNIIHRWHAAGLVDTVVPVFLPQAGFYTLTLALEPPCPALGSPTLACRSAGISGMRLTDLMPLDPPDPVAFAGGVTLLASQVTRQESRLSVWLTWQFDNARSQHDIRFVHVVDSLGRLVAQNDTALGARPAGSQWAEAVTIHLPSDLLQGDYRVFAGWYTYPDTTPLSILSDQPDAEHGRLEVGIFSVE